MVGWIGIADVALPECEVRLGDLVGLFPGRQRDGRSVREDGLAAVERRSRDLDGLVPVARIEGKRQLVGRLEYPRHPQGSPRGGHRNLCASLAVCVRDGLRPSAERIQLLDGILHRPHLASA